MQTELNDEVPVPRFEDNLSRELARIHDRERADAPHPGVGRRRRPGRRSLLAGAGAIAAAAVLIAGVVATGSDGSSDEPELPGLEARIIAASRSAAEDLVVHETTSWTEDPVVSETWRDETSLSFRLLIHAPSGGPASDWGQIDIPSAPAGERPPGTRTVRSVDYCNAEYTVEELSLYSDDEVDVSVLVSIVDGLADGSMHVDGTEVVDGRELIRVVVEDSAPDVLASTFLVDPETYLPVQASGDVVEAPNGAFHETYEYLPRTPDNLARLLTADPPAGFQQVDQLSGDHVASCN